MATRLSKERLEGFRRQLLERKRDLWSEVVESLRDDLKGEYQQQLQQALDDPDRAMVDLLGDLDIIRLENRRDELMAIEAALQRIDQGTFGVCTDCGQTIEPRRLQVMPYATRCVEDQAEAEGETQPPRL
jgi:DnaK suppressor protein